MEGRLRTTETIVANLASEMEEVKARLAVASRDAAEANKYIVSLQRDLDGKHHVHRQHVPRDMSQPLGHVDSDSDLDSEEDSSTEGFELMHAEYALDESVWSTILFVGNASIGAGGTITTLCIFVVYLFCLVVLWCVVMFNFTDNDFADYGKDFRHWRISFAHSSKYYDSISNKSLATRVCDDSKAMAFSSAHGQYIHDLNEYLYKSDKFGGPTMCTAAIFVWIVAIAKELKESLDFFHAMLSVPIGKHTVVNRADGSCSLMCISRVKLVLIGVTVVLRIAVALCLAWAGCQWLVYTMSVSDLLLNAVALQFVLDLDEYLFAALSPWRITSVVKSMEPIRLRALTSRAGEFRSLCSLLISILFTVLVVTTYYLPFRENLLQLEREVCGGATDFVIHESPVGIPVSYVTLGGDGTKLPYPGNNGGMKSGPNSWLLALAIQNKSELSHYTVLTSDLSTTKFSFDDWASISIYEASLYLNPSCNDMLSEEGWPAYFRVYLQNASGMMKVDCRKVESFCTADTTAGHFTRMMCPETCECWNTRNAMSNSAFGCPSSCVMSPDLRLVRMETSCEDVAVDSFEWESFIDQMATVVPKWSFQPFWTDIVVSLMSCGGCNSRQSVMNDFQVDPCSDDGAWPFAPIASLCPVTCDCPDPALAACPDTCQFLIREEPSDMVTAIGSIKASKGQKSNPLKDWKAATSGEASLTSYELCIQSKEAQFRGFCGSLCSDDEQLLPENVSYVSEGTQYLCSEAELYMETYAKLSECSEQKNYLKKHCCRSI
jgi:hypothetical protein